MKNSDKELIIYFDNIDLAILGILFIIFPLFFLNSTTDAFVLPKEILLSFAVALFVIVFGLKTIAEGRLKLRSSPFDLPVILFALVLLCSAIFSVNFYDAMTAFVPMVFVILLYFCIINIIRTEKQLLIILSSAVLGATLTSLMTILSYFKVYPLPFDYTHLQYFTTFGALLDQAIYLAVILPITAFFAYSFITSFTSSKQQQSPFAVDKQLRGASKINGLTILFSGAFVIIAIALGLTIALLATSQKPLLLPYDTGLQTGFAAVSQDSGHVFKSFLLGSGFGTYINDFTRFKQASFNNDETLWTYTFFRSSSFLLELLATTGILGILSFGFILYKVIKEKNFFLPLMLASVAALILPFSFTLEALFFLMLGIFAVIRIHNDPERFAELEFYFVALKRGLLTVKSEGERIAQNPAEKRYNKLLPVIFLVILLIIVGVPLYYTIRYTLSDMTFQKSLIAAQNNNGQQTYDLERDAISLFPYRDIYYRAFSQTNLALANALASSQKRGQPNQQMQQNILTLIQQSITSGRTAATVAPLTTFDWNNLSSIYRSLIGFGQNADQFTILTEQQAVALDPNNPQQYIDFGGIYYQLGNYDNAAQEFEIAIHLKPDYANAYYNLGHAYEAKGDLQDALVQFETVKTLVEANPSDLGKINSEIAALDSTIGNQQANRHGTGSTPGASQQLDVNQPGTTLPQRKPEAKIPAPTVQVTPLPSPTQAPAGQKTSPTP
jgi:tetratricopeptide (TPR) repeat protein